MIRNTTLSKLTARVFNAAVALTLATYPLASAFAAPGFGQSRDSQNSLFKPYEPKAPAPFAASAPQQNAHQNEAKSGGGLFGPLEQEQQVDGPVYHRNGSLGIKPLHGPKPFQGSMPE